MGDTKLSPAGIELDPGSTTVFGGKAGPRVMLPDTGRPAGRSTVPLLLEFAVGGLVQLTAEVSG